MTTFGLARRARAIGRALTAAAAVALGAGGAPAAAQSIFEPVAAVNGETINRYEVDQRSRFLELLRAPDVGFATTRERLIDEALQVQAARAAAIEVTEADVDTGMEEFAARADLTVEELLPILDARGIAPETYRAFVRAGLLWRLHVQETFRDRARPDPVDVERAMAGIEAPPGRRVLLAEIAVPAPAGGEDDARTLADRLARRIRTEDAFAQAARRYSRAPSAERGGLREWTPLAELPPAIAAAVAGLEPGQISAPVPQDGYVGVYLLRDEDATNVSGRATRTVDYAEYRLPPGPAAASEVARLRARVATCDDLYGVARGAPDRLLRQALPVAAVPADVAGTIAALDEGEAAVVAAADGGTRLVMVCERRTDGAEDLLERASQEIVGERLAGYAATYLDELRADAVIERF